MKRWGSILLVVGAVAFAGVTQAAGNHGGGHGEGGHGGHGEARTESGGGDAHTMGQGHATGHGHSGGHASAAGEPGNAAEAARTIDVVMGEPGEFRFTPDRIQIKAGETVRFRARNAGKLPHEIVLGDPAELQEHAKAMREQPAMAHKDANSLTLEPGKAGELVWRFTNPGEFQFACLVPGHFEAGMKGTAVVNQ